MERGNLYTLTNTLSTTKFLRRMNVIFSSANTFYVYYEYIYILLLYRSIIHLRNACRHIHTHVLLETSKHLRGRRSLYKMKTSKTVNNNKRTEIITAATAAIRSFVYIFNIYECIFVWVWKKKRRKRTKKKKKKKKRCHRHHGDTIGFIRIYDRGGCARAMR